MTRSERTAAALKANAALDEAIAEEGYQDINNIASTMAVSVAEYVAMKQRITQYDTLYMELEALIEDWRKACLSARDVPQTLPPKERGAEEGYATALEYAIFALRGRLATVERPAVKP